MDQILGPKYDFVNVFYVLGISFEFFHNVMYLSEHWSKTTDHMVFESCSHTK